MERLETEERGSIYLRIDTIRRARSLRGISKGGDLSLAMSLLYLFSCSERIDVSSSLFLIGEVSRLWTCFRMKGKDLCYYLKTVYVVVQAEN